MFRVHVHTFSIRQSLPGNLAPSNTEAISLGERRMRPSREDEAARQRADLLHRLVDRFDDHTVNRVLPIVDWTNPTPLTKREVRLIERAAEEAQTTPEPLNSRQGMSYFGASNRLHDGQFQGHGVTHSTGISHWMQSSRACDLVYKPIAAYETEFFSFFGIKSDGDNNLHGRNIATLETAHALNMPEVIPNTYVGHTERGPTLYMEHLRGIPMASYQADNLFSLSVPFKAEEISRELAGWNENLSRFGLKIADHDDHLIRLSMAEESRAIHQIAPHDAEGRIVDGRLNRDLCRLAWLDLVCGQTDRNRSNVLVDYDEEGRATRIVGIDNDMAYGEGVSESTVTSPVTRDTLHWSETSYRGLPDVVDSDTALAIQKLASEPQRTQYLLMLEANQLTAAERQSALQRLDAAVLRIDTWQKEASMPVARSTMPTEIQTSLDRVDDAMIALMNEPELTAGNVEVMLSCLNDARQQLSSMADAPALLSAAGDKLASADMLGLQIRMDLTNMHLALILRQQQAPGGMLEKMRDDIKTWRALCEAALSAGDGAVGRARASTHILPPEPENWVSISGPYSVKLTQLNVAASTICRVIQPQAIRAALQPRVNV